MAIFHPGDRTLTEQMIQLGGFRAGDRILDLGCGDGETMSCMRDAHGIKPYGCDMDQGIIDRALSRDPALKIRRTEGVELDYPSLYFDGAIMECSFSLMTRHDELLHELYCVLKPGARAVMSDLYVINPDPQRAEATYRAAMAVLNTPRQESDCEKSALYPSPYILDGAFMQDRLIAAVRETGFEITAFKDKTPELRDFYAQAIMDYGSMDAFWAAELPEGSESCNFCRTKPGKNTGYFIMAMEKPAK